MTGDLAQKVDWTSLCWGLCRQKKTGKLPYTAGPKHHLFENVRTGKVPHTSIRRDFARNFTHAHISCYLYLHTKFSKQTNPPTTYFALLACAAFPLLNKFTISTHTFNPSDSFLHCSVGSEWAWAAYWLNPV